MKSYDLSYVRSFCSKKGIGVVSFVYINGDSKMDFLCLSCKNIWSTAFFVIKRGSGCPNCAKKKKLLTLDEVKNRINKVSNGIISLNEQTYIDTKHQCCFLDKVYGEWWATPSNIFAGQKHPKRVQQQRRETCIKRYGMDTVLRNTKMKREAMLKKYGVPWASQHSDIRLKAAKSTNKIVFLKHWFSNEDVLCQGSYEVAVVNYFNKNKIDYNWQIQTFLMPNEKTFTPDLYLPDQDLWVEVKGYFWADAKEKWDWFHETYPNSELWETQKLKELEIL